jgi:hypothetical protein
MTFSAAIIMVAPRAALPQFQGSSIAVLSAALQGEAVTAGTIFAPTPSINPVA